MTTRCSARRDLELRIPARRMDRGMSESAGWWPLRCRAEHAFAHGLAEEAKDVRCREPLLLEGNVPPRQGEWLGEAEILEQCVDGENPLGRLSSPEAAGLSRTVTAC